MGNQKGRWGALKGRKEIRIKGEGGWGFVSG